MIRRPTLTENKLVILSIIDKLGRLSSQQVLRFAVENDIMGYFDMQMALTDMASAKLLSETPSEFGILYEMTPQGRDTYNMFIKSVPYSRRTQIAELAPTWKERFRKESQVLSEWNKSPDGEYIVNLRVHEHGVMLVDIKISVPEKEQAKHLAAAWELRADRVFEQMIKTLSAPLDGPSD